MQFPTILAKICIEQVLNFAVRKKDKINYFRFSKCDRIAALRVLNVFCKNRVFGFNRISLYLVIKGNEYKESKAHVCTTVLAESSQPETFMNNLHNPRGIWCFHFKWDFIFRVLYNVYTKCFLNTKAGAGCYNLAVSPI